MKTAVNRPGAAPKMRQSFILVLSLLLMLGLGVVQAFSAEPGGGYHGGTGGGFSGPGLDIITVEKAKSMPDDTMVALKGNIIQSLGGKDYIFKDGTGTINVEISPKVWQGQDVSPKDVIEIQGEVDKDWTSLEIEVKRLIKQK